MHGDALTASCRTIDNHWGDTWLGTVSECEGDIANLDGTLSCPR